MAEWTWKAKQSGSANLLYEPGNWGDLLKGRWLVDVFAWLSSHRDEFGMASYYDLFAGAPSYPAARTAQERIAALGDSLFSRLAKPWIAKGEWPSAAMLAMACRPQEEISVYDADAERRAAWKDCPNTVLLELECGYDGIACVESSSAGLLLIDPYDFMKDWREQLEVVVEASRRINVLVYIYNRSAKTPEALREYRAFRNRLDDLCDGRRTLVGRVAADAFLPKAHHEMLFLPCPAVAEHADFAALADSLAGGVHGLAEVIRQREIFEG